MGDNMKLSETNINIETGIRYGTISTNNVNYFFDEAEPVYPEPEPKFDDELNEIELTEEEIEAHYDGLDPLHFKIDNETLQAHTFWDTTCIMITHSEYYTFTRLCSPCVPNAGDLDTPDERGYKTYCLGHDFFGIEGAPYRVFRVSDDSEVIIEHD